MILRLLEVARDRAGTAVLELAFVLPLLVIVLLAVLQFGIFFYEYVLIENSAVLGVRTLLANRPVAQASNTCPTSGFGSPYSATTSAIIAAAGGLPVPLTTNNITLTVGGTTCTTDPACSTALCSAYAATGAYSVASNWTAETASVTVTYPSCLTLLPVGWVPGNFCPGGHLTSTVTQRVN
jgi:hypothetical protein